MKLSLKPLYDVFGGITEFYAALFTAVSIFMAFKNILTGVFVAAIGAITTLITANDIHNDIQNVNQNTNITDVTVASPTAASIPALVAPLPPVGNDNPGGAHS